MKNIIIRLWKLVVVVYIRIILAENWVSLKKKVDNLINFTSPIKSYIRNQVHITSWKNWNRLVFPKSENRPTSIWSYFFTNFKRKLSFILFLCFFVVPLLLTMLIQWHKNHSIWLRNEKNIRICSMIDLCLTIGGCALLTLCTRNHNEFWYCCCLII
jgi:hypothetical protein